MPEFTDLIDLHTHSTASGHAYSTLMENIAQAQKLGLRYYGLSDHAPAMPYATQPMYFRNFKVIPRDWGGLRFLAGVELNILDAQGTIDLTVRELRLLDYAIISLHSQCCKPLDPESNTQAYLGAMKAPNVRIVGHPDDGRFEYDHEALVREAKERHILIEVNNASLKPPAYRLNAPAIITDVLAYCRQYRVPVIMDSDAHFALSVGGHAYSRKLLEELSFPDELIVNYHEELIREYFPEAFR